MLTPFIILRIDNKLNKIGKINRPFSDVFYMNRIDNNFIERIGF